MATLFSFAFSGIFLAFIVVAIVGHVLVIDALVRPFFGRLTVANRVPLTANGMLPRPAR